MLVVGIDLGSTRIKVVAFDADGRARSSASAPLSVLHSAPDRAEVDMRATWVAVRRLLRETVEALDRPDIVGIGVTAAGAGLWPTDVSGEPVGPAVLWNDGRAADLMQIWMRSGITARVSELSSNAVMPGYPIPMLAWLSQHEPAALDAIGRIHFAKDWIGFCLTGEWATDPSDASLGFIDQDRMMWAPEVAEAVGLDGIYEKFPPIRPATEVRGVIREDLSAELGLRKDCVVSVGLMDVAATVLGAGAAEVGDACTILGTSAINGVISDSPGVPPSGIGQVIALPDGLWLKTLVNTSGTQALDWLTSVLDDGSAGLDADDIEALASSSIDGARGLLFHPYLSLAGSIAPFVHPGARGNLFGLTTSSSRSDIARAVFEGVALAVAECYSAMGSAPESLRLAGGGARSPLWRQLIGDLLGAHVVCSRHLELGARGAALTAWVAAGVHPTLASARRAWSDDNTTTSPDPSRVVVLASRRPVFRQLADAFSTPWTQILTERPS